MIRNVMRWPLVVCIRLILLASLGAFGQQWHPPPPEKRCPSPWGANDERGAANHVKPKTVLKGLRLVKEGRIYALGRVLEPAMPTFARWDDGEARLGRAPPGLAGPPPCTDIRTTGCLATSLRPVGPRLRRCLRSRPFCGRLPAQWLPSRPWPAPRPGRTR